MFAVSEVFKVEIIIELQVEEFSEILISCNFQSIVINFYASGI